MLHPVTDVWPSEYHKVHEFSCLHLSQVKLKKKIMNYETMMDQGTELPLYLFPGPRFANEQTFLFTSKSGRESKF